MVEYLGHFTFKIKQISLLTTWLAILHTDTLKHLKQRNANRLIPNQDTIWLFPTRPNRIASASCTFFQTENLRVQR